MKVRPAIVIIENNKILCLKYIYNATTVYNIPGGNLEFGEKMHDALQRELLEELKVEVEVSKLLMVGEVHQNNQDTLHFIFEGKITNGAPTLDSKNTSSIEAVWLDMNDLHAVNLYPNVNLKLANWFFQLSEHSVYVGEIDQVWF